MKLLENVMKAAQKTSLDMDRSSGESIADQEKTISTGSNMLSSQPMDLVILDDIFPHPLSAFRMQEYISYLKEFKHLEIYSSGASVGLLGERTFDEVITDFKGKHPEYADRIQKITADTTLNARLVYCIFLINAYLHIQKIEEANVPFVFTLYPGGGFGLNIAESDEMLQRVISSPCFRKVIVTQKVTYDYLIDNNYCKPDQIKFIFGVVTPLEYVNIEYKEKKHFGIDKETLDICFVAYKYTEKGVDKGYDIFIEVARQLCQNYQNINFHVVGGIDEHEIDVTGLKGRITFYGKRDTEWFNNFYKDKDIILSPNIPGTMYPGSFDGFPTGSCVDAGLRKTAMFCTDELGLNAKTFSEGTHFVEGEDIVIIPHDAAKITGMIESYYRDPQKLKAIAESGRLRIKQLYGFDAQLSPRINLLKKEIELADKSREVITQAMNRHTKPSNSPHASSVRRILGNSFGQLLKLIGKKNVQDDIAVIRSSSLFDETWYLENNPDVGQTQMDPALHYLLYGGFEGRDPGPAFYGNGYLDSYPDVKSSRMNPLLHYLKHGAKEGRTLPTREVVQLAKPRFTCPVCQNELDNFVPLDSYHLENWKKSGFPYSADDFETLNWEQHFCPICGGADRDRLYALYLSEAIRQNFTEEPLSILDIAPSLPLRAFLQKYPIKYQSADKYMEDVDLVLDITNMHSIPDETYDFFICSHVLEHILDDKKALSELFRILKTGGSGILMVPINLRIDKIEEDPSLEDVAERWRRFGQDDHIRLYSKKGFIERVEAAGFAINQYGIDFFGKDVFFQHGISPKSILYIVEKN